MTNMITIKRIGQADITEATLADLEGAITDMEYPTAFVDCYGAVIVYRTEEAYAADPEGSYPDLIIDGDGADDLAESAGIDVMDRM